MSTKSSNDTEYKYQPSVSGDVNLVEVANYIYSHKTFILVAAIAAAALVGFWGFFFSTPVYKSYSTIVYNMATTNPLERENNAYWMEQYELENKMFILGIFFNSAKYREAIVDEVYRKNPLPNENEEQIKFRKVVRSYIKEKKIKGRENIAGFLAGHLSFNIDQQKRTMYITAQSSTPFFSQALANMATNTFINLNYEEISKEMNSVVAFIEEQTEFTKNKLYALEDELAALQKNQKILSVGETSNAIDRIQVDNEMAFTNLKLDRTLAEMWIQAIEGSITDFKNGLQSGVDSPMYMVQLQRRLDFLMYQKNLVTRERGVASVDEAQASDSLQKAITDFQQSFDQLRKTNLTSDPWTYLKSLEKDLMKAKEKLFEAETKLSARQKVTFAAERKYATLPEVLKTISQLKRNIDLTSNLYEQLKSKLQETQIKKAGKINDLMIVQTPSYPGNSVGSSIWKRYAFAFIGALFVTVMLLTVRFVLLPTIRSRNDFKKMNIEVIAEIPFAKFNEESEVNVEYPLLLKGLAASQEANSIRQARFNLEQKLDLHIYRDKHEAKVITVCSANAREGKSFTAANLAYAFASAQYQVLLLDIDVLNLSVRKYFSLESKDKEDSSLTSGDFFFVKHKVNSFLTLIDIPSTKSSVTDILETPLLSDVINSMRSRYDVVIIDTPPIRNSLEPLIASRHSDAMVFVANQRGTLRHDAYKAIDTLRETYAGRIYAILNFSYDELSSTERRVSIERQLEEKQRKAS